MDDRDITYKKIVEESQTGVLVGELATRKILYINDAYLKMTHIQDNDPRDTCYGMFRRYDHPCEDCQVNQLKDGEIDCQRIFLPNIRKYFMIRRKKIDWNGIPAWIEYTTDETEHSNEERVTKHLLENLPCGIGIFEVVNQKVIQKYLNDSYFAMLGTTREEREKYFGENTLEPIHQEDLPKLRCAIVKALEGDGQIDITLRLLSGRSQYEWFRLKAVNVNPNQPKAVFHCAYFYVDTEKKARDREIEAREVMNAAIGYSGLLYWEYNYDTKRVTLIGDSDLNGYIPKVLENVPESWFSTGIRHPKYNDTVRRMFKRLHEGDTSVSCEVQTYNRKGNELHWQHIAMTALKNPDGRTYKAIGIAHNITEQRQAADRYDELLTYQKTKRENSIVFIHIDIASNQVLEYINRMPNKVELNPSDTSELFLRKVMKAYPSLERQLPGAGYGSCGLRLLRAYEEGKSYFSSDVLKEDEVGYHNWYNIRIELIKNPNSGDVECYIAATDINQTKLPHLIFQKLRGEDIDYLSYVDCKTGENHLFHRQGDKYHIIKQSYEELYHAIVEGIVGTEIDHVQRTLRYSELTMQLHKRGSLTLVYPIRQRHEMMEWKQLRIFYMDENKEIIVFVRTDITEIYQKQKEEEKLLQDALREAERANHAKSDFLSQMSHDMRTPMNAIMGLATLALDESMSEEVRDCIQKISSSGEILLGLINDVLDMSRIESGKVDLHPELYDYEEFLHTIRATFDQMCASKHITLHVDQSEKVYPILVDRVRFNQIFFNLLSNAIKYTPEGGEIYFFSRGEKLADERVQCSFELQDTGIGMTEEFLKHVFEPFVRERDVENTTQGTGIGLSITKNLIELMGGTIEIESEKNVGTTVRVRVVLEEAHHAVNSDVIFSEQELSHILTNRRVLVVEDNPMNQEIAMRLLAKKGIHVETADDGVRGVERFQQSSLHYYDAILMDIRMPNLNGIEATKAIRLLEREDAETIPIIAMTADAYEEDRKQSLEAGMDEHLSKPVNTQQLYQALARLIRQ